MLDEYNQEEYTHTSNSTTRHDSRYKILSRMHGNWTEKVVGLALRNLAAMRLARIEQAWRHTLGVRLSLLYGLQ